MTAISQDSEDTVSHPEHYGSHSCNSGSPPPFGHAILQYFGFAPGYVNLNHGSYGSLPLPVLAECEKLGRQIEANPDRFLRLTYQPLLEDARERVSRLLGAHKDECVLVPNATHGLNTILRNIKWNEGDIMVGAATTYVNVDLTLRYLHDIHPKTILAPFELRLPTAHATIIENYRAHLRALKATLPNFTPHATGALTGPGSPKIVAVVDSIISNPGVHLPWREMVAICREEGVWSVVDAAHSIGQEPCIDLAEARPDFYVTNCHKWLFAKRGIAVLYVPFRNQHVIKSSIPTGNSYGTPQATFVKQHEWTGTIDMVPMLSIKPALEFRAWLGGEEKITEYCHALALKGGKRLAEVMGTRVMDDSENAELTLNMVNVELPFPKDLLEAPELTVRMLDEFHTSAGVFRHDGRWWARCSAQIWNEVSDFEYIGKVFNTIAKDMKSNK